MKVLYISPNAYIGGAEKFILRIIKEHNINHEITPALLCFQEGELVDKVREIGTPCHVIETKFRLRNPLSTLKAMLEIRKILIDEKPDIVHSTMPYSHLMIGLIMFFTRLKFKEVWFQHGPVGGLLDKIASLFPTDCIIYNSQFTKDHHLQTCWVPPRKSKIIKLGFNIKEFKESDNSETIQAIFLGRICEWKGIHNILKALQRLKNIPIQLRVFGRANTVNDQKYLNKLQKDVQSVLPSKVSFNGHTNEISKVFDESHLLIHSSTIPEPFGLVIGEAMANSVFVISSNCGGAADLVEDGVTGFSYDSLAQDSPELIAKKIEDFYRLTKKERSVITKKAYQKIKDHFSIKQMTQSIEKLYNSL